MNPVVGLCLCRRPQMTIESNGIGSINGNAKRLNVRVSVCLQSWEEFDKQTQMLKKFGVNHFDL